MRHGESLANREGWLAGHFDAPLTERGEAQAQAARELLPRPRPARAFCSDLRRAHRTAALLLETEEIPLVRHPALRERALGSWQRRSVAELQALGVDRARMGSWHGRPPGGESLFDVALRVVGWATTVDSTDDTLVVAHGALMRAVLAVVDGLPRDRLDLRRPGNCESIARVIPYGAWAEWLDELRAEAVTHHAHRG